ncbi:MAG: hypothetical protein U9Q22_01125 [Candidatus Altiarchaeota archaeon]|nr:hypothetical protein [Candidatus Altiarchaeota archaeon]
MNQKILFGILVTGIFLISGCVEKPVVKECSLSLCDCKCYLKGEAPEESSKKLCGINCLDEYGVTGCEYREGDCVEIYVKKNESVKEEKKTKEFNYCEIDSDCASAQCCHPTSCINKKYAPKCTDVMCTMVCQGPIDCGAGRCACRSNNCVVESSQTS